MNRRASTPDLEATLDPTLLSHVLETSINEIYVFDATTLRFVQANARARSNLGYTMDELQELTPLDLKREFTEAGFRAIIQPLRTGEMEGRLFHTHHERKDGSRYPVEVHLQLVQWNPRPVFVAIILDISERIELQDRYLHAQKMETVGRLSSGLAHDLNNVLAGVLAGCRVARLKLDRNDTSGTRQLVQDIEASVARSSGLIRHLLDYSRTTPAKAVMVNPADVVSTSCPVIGRLLGADVRIHVSTLSTGRFRGDPWRTEQALINLCVNARDAMPRGGSLWIETSDVDVIRDGGSGLGRGAEGPHVLVAVRDTGSGMSTRVRSRAFEPYFTTKDEGRGTGLGLATVAQIVNEAGGFIELDSREGRGTTFRLYFPAEPQAGIYSDAAGGGPPEGRGERVLLVEDEPLLRAATKDLLEELGYRPLTAATPEVALELSTVHGSDLGLVITDVVLPGMDGPELVSRIRRRLPDVPAVFSSGYPQANLVKRGSLPPDAHFLQKPYTEEELATSVRAALDAGARA